MPVLTRAHETNVVPLQGNHFIGGESLAGCAWLPFDSDQFAVNYFSLKLLADFTKRSLAHSSLQRISQQTALVGYRFAFKVLFQRVVKGLPDRSLRLFMAWRIHLKGVFPCLPHYAVSLVSKLVRHFQVPLLHLFAGNVQLRVTGSMRRNLGCFRAAQALLFQVLLDLLPSWTRRLDIFGGVAFNLGCAVC